MPLTRPTTSTKWVYDDGGRSGYFKGAADDCVARAVAIALQRDYKQVYDDLASMMAGKGKPKSARNGIDNKATRQYLADQGWDWTPTMFIGSGCQVHLRTDELPTGTIIAKLSGHVVAVIDGVVHDTHDPSRGGTRCVYGYWSAP